MRTLVVSSNVLDPVSTQLRGVLRNKPDLQGPSVAQYADVEGHLAQSQEELLLVVLSSDPEGGLDTLRRARRLTSAYMVAVGPTSEPKLILRALQDGADHFLDEDELESGLEAALARRQNKGERAAPPGRLITVLAASGGSGASTLAVNIAAVLAKEHERCALLDLKPGRGDLAALLDLKPAFHLADLCVNAARLDKAMFEKVLLPHSTGVHLLASPQLFGDTRLVTSQGVGQVLTLARKLFANVVVDLEDCFHEEQVLTLKQAGAIVMVSRLDFTSLRNARRILEHLTAHDIPRSRVRLVVNRYGQPNELPAEQAEEALGGKIAHYIPDDSRTINGSNNTGIPAVVKAPTARVCRAITQLARDTLDRRRPEPARPAKAFWR
jgi:pilus assembly protein CpaE